MTAGSILGHLAVRDARTCERSAALAAAGERGCKSQSGANNEVPDDEVRDASGITKTRT